MVCQFQSKDLNLGISLLCQHYEPPRSMFSLASIHSVFLTTFSTEYFNYILPLGTLKQTESNSSKSYQLVRDWVQAMLYLQSPPLIQYVPPLQAMRQGSSLWSSRNWVLFKRVINSLKCINIFGTGVRTPGWIQTFSSSILLKRLIGPPPARTSLKNLVCGRLRRATLIPRHLFRLTRYGPETSGLSFLPSSSKSHQSGSSSKFSV